MGTSTNRSSCNPEYYKQGGVVIPGVQADGMDVLAVREAVKVCRDHASSGKGPIFLELRTYRYHGHSMSDPGITYRDRDEVASMRAAKDCIEQVKARLVDSGWATADELKAQEKDIRAYVSAQVRRRDVGGGCVFCALPPQPRQPAPASWAQVEEARKGSLPRPELLVEDIYAAPERPPFIRTAEFGHSYRFPQAA
jgi:TPP-dependent pyruvate/acetoin dehydrogenase alpha subunit